MSSRNPKKKMPRFVLALCGLLLVGTATGCQLSHHVQKQAVSHPRRLQFGWPPFGKADRSQAADILHVGSHGIEPVNRRRSNVSDAPRDPKWAKWLDYLPKAPRIPLPRTDTHESDIAVLEPVESPPQDGRDLMLLPINQNMSNRSLLR